MFLRASKQKRCRHFQHLVACESKKSLTIFPTSPIKKLLFRHISGVFLIMALITTVSLSLSSIKLGNNFNCDIYLLMTVSSLFISNKKSTILQLQYWLIIDWLPTNNRFWCRMELKMWISCALFEQNRFFLDNVTHAVLWKKRWTLSWKSVKEVSPPITVSESTKTGRAQLIFSRFTQKQLQIHDGTRNGLKYASIIGTNEIHAFFITNAFFSTQHLLSFLMNWASNHA